MAGDKTSSRLVYYLRKYGFLKLWIYPRQLGILLFIPGLSSLSQFVVMCQVWWQEVLQSIQRRGPDCSGCHRAIAGPPDDRKDTSCPGPASPRVTCDPAMKPVTTPEDPDGCSCPGCGSVLVLCSTLDLHGSVLHLRGGAHATAQPLVNESTGDVLLWNGEIFDGIEVSACSMLCMRSPYCVNRVNNLPMLNG